MAADYKQKSLQKLSQMQFFLLLWGEMLPSELRPPAAQCTTQMQLHFLKENLSLILVSYCV